MPEYGYALENFDKSRHVRASIRDKSASHKHAREVAVAIKGMSIEKARLFLEDVIARKIAVPYRRYNNEVAHRSNIRDGYCSGRYPKKSCPRSVEVVGQSGGKC